MSLKRPPPKEQTEEAPEVKKTRTEANACAVCGKVAPRGLTRHLGCAKETMELRCEAQAARLLTRDFRYYFPCPECEFKTKSQTEMKEHYSAHTKQNNTVAHQQSVPKARSQDSDILDKFALAINFDHWILLCRDCKVLVDPSNPKAHYSSHHHGLRMDAENLRRLASFLSTYPELTIEPQHPGRAVDQIAHLPVSERMLCCEGCQHCYTNRKAYSKHPCKNASPPKIGQLAQRFRENNRSPWFPVIPPQTPPSSTGNLWHAYQKQREEQESTQTPSMLEEHRILHQFLSKEGWIDKIGVIPHENLMEAIAVSTKDEVLNCAVGVCVSYLSKCQAAIDSYFIRRLIGARPLTDKAQPHAPSHGNVSSPALRKYARVIAGVLHMVRQMDDVEAAGYKLNFSSAVLGDVEEFFEALEGVQGTSEEGPGDFLADEDEGFIVDEDGEVLQEDGFAPDGLEQEGRTDTDDTELNGTERVLHRVLSALYLQLPRTHPGKQSPLLEYVMLSSLRPKREWLKTSLITQRIAAIAFTGRLFFSRLIQENLDKGAVSNHEAFKPYEIHLQEEGEGPMPSLYLLMRGLSGLKSAEGNMILFSAKDWSGSSVTINGHDIELHQIRSALERLIEDIQNDLDGLLMHRPESELSPGIRIYDEPRNTSAGFCFIDHKKNVWHQIPSLLQHILSSPAVFDKFGFINNAGAICWKPGACSQYMLKAFHLQSKFFVAMTLTYGEPARGSEIASNLLRNVGGGSIRNAFVVFDTFVLRGSYNKTSLFSSSDKTMVRAPLPELSRLFIQFLVFVRPLYAEWQRCFLPRMYHNSVHFLFCGLKRPVESADLSRSLAAWTETQLGLAMPFSIHRQFMAFITSCNRRLFSGESDSSGTDQQLGHSSRMDRQHYGHDARFPAQIDWDSFRVSVEISAIFQLLFGFNATLLDKLYVAGTRTATLMQTVHLYRNPPPDPITETLRATSQNLSMQSLAKEIAYNMSPHLVQTVGGALDESYASVVHLLAPDMVDERSHVLKQGALVLTHPHFLAKLRDYLGDPSGHKGFYNTLQAQATQLAFERRLSFLYISPTGSGKTLPAMLCSKSMDDGRFTIWMLPMKAMHEQCISIHKAQGMECVVWRPSITVGSSVNGVVATVELTQSDAFHRFVDRSVSAGRLARIVFDEAHLILTHESFRPVMRTLRWCGEHGVQVMLLTATMPPALQSRLLKMVGLSMPVVLRVETPRANISYTTIKVASEDRVQSAVLHSFQQALRDGQRVLVFCFTVAEVLDYATKLGVPGCHAMMEPDGLALALQSFREGTVRALVSTCMLGVGLDVPGVTHVIHVGIPRTALGFIQEVGRLGRDSGTPRAVSIVIACPCEPNTSPTDEPFGSKIMYDWFWNDNECRRLAIQNFVDGSAVPCAMLPGPIQLCEICAAQASKIPNQTSLSLLRKPGPSRPPPKTTGQVEHCPQIASLISKAKHYEPLPHFAEYVSVIQVGATFGETCIACHVVGGEDDTHKFPECPITNMAAFTEWKTNLSFGDGICYQCGLPQKARYTKNGKHEYVHPFQANEKDYICPFLHAFLPAAFATYGNAKLQKMVVRSDLRHETAHNDFFNPFSEWIVEEFETLSNVVRFIHYLCSQSVIKIR